MAHPRNDASIDNGNVSNARPSDLSLIYNQLRFSNYEDSVLSEYAMENVSHVFKTEKAINLLLLQEQNLTFPKCSTDVLFRCSNGYVRAHSLIMLKSTLISNTLKDEEENGHINNLRQRTVGVNDFKVEHIVQLLFLFYTGQTCFAMDERKTFTRLLKLFGVREDSFELAVPLKYSEEYKESLSAKMQDHRLRMGLTRMGSNNDVIEEEYFVRSNGSMEPMTRRTPELDPAIGNAFYCADCKCTFGGCGTLQSHKLEKHRNQPEKSRNPTGSQIPSYRNDMEDIRISQRTQYGGATSVSARRQLLEKYQAPIHDQLKRKTPARNSNQEFRDVENAIIYSPTITSTPTGPTPTTSRSFRRQTHDKPNSVCCNICFIIKESESDMIIHQRNSHSHIRDFNGKSVPCPLNTTSAAKGHKCISCQDVYIKGVALQDHYQRVHGIVDATHYTLSPDPKCLVCKKKWTKHNQNSSFFLDHVRKCFENIENGAAQKKGQKRKSSSIIVPPKRAIPWYKDMRTAVVDVLPQQPPKQTLTAIPEPIAGPSAPHRQKKKKLEISHREVEKSLEKTPVRVLRGRNVRLPSKIPKKQPRQKIAKPSIPEAEQDDINVPEVAVVTKKAKSKAIVATTASTETATYSKKKLKSKAATQLKAFQNREIKNQNPHNLQHDESSDSDIIFVSSNVGSEVLKLGMNKEITEKTNKSKRKIEKEVDVAPVAGPSRAGNITNERLSTGSVVPSHPKYHSTGLFSETHQDSRKSVPPILLQKVNDKDNVGAWVCNSNDETYSDSDLPSREPETHRSSSDTTYITTGQIEEIVPKGDRESTDEMPGYEGLSCGTLLRMPELVTEYAQGIGNSTLQNLTQNTDVNSHFRSRETWLLTYPHDVTDIFQ